ncbi:MAG: acetate/propionate family kinase [bacterium]
MNILIVNVGSTSLKYKLYSFPEEIVLAQGKIERIGSETSFISHLSLGKAPIQQQQEIKDYPTAIQLAITLLTDKTHGIIDSLTGITAIGFKTVVAKGFSGAVVLDDQVISAMASYNSVAPSHNPPYINAIRCFKQLYPEIPLVGLFEPAFHQEMPEYATTLGVPTSWVERYGIRKYGFHGASHRYIAERVTEIVGKEHRLISCHLGGSSSLCAIKNGKSIDTSMSFSPQSGTIHANRIGDLDPFAVLYVMDQENLSTAQMRTILCKESGLAGISGIKGGDMRDLTAAAETGNRSAQLAIDSFIYGIQKYIGTYLVALNGLDILVFTGGIGENSELVRKKVCTGLSFLGIKLDAAKNTGRGKETAIHTADSTAQIWIIPTNEELIVARAVEHIIKSQ